MRQHLVYPYHSEAGMWLLVQLFAGYMLMLVVVGLVVWFVLMLLEPLRLPWLRWANRRKP